MDEREIFLAVLEIDGPSQQSAYLDEVCGGDEALRERIDALLRVQVEENSFLREPFVQRDDADPLSEGPGSVIGRYKLLEQIGEGGFGVVYMAQQREPVERRVALKIIKLGMDTKQVVGRFEAERQALALMDHPNIAKVFDGGATETGRPYFVMELVNGIPLTDFCDSAKLATRNRLELFVQVCSAVQHAHQKGIIHRDLKPSNVMVTLHDDKPVPKVIDFGVAKATQHRLTEKTVFTRFQHLIGTPLYMSPEQATFSGLDIDTRSDIYSLGIMLYELLTGTTPLDAKKLQSTAYDELCRIIREDQPPLPSTRISTLGEQLQTIADNRRTDPRMLRRTIRGELDWIVMKALEKDRARRYESANSLALDVQRFLSHQPVLAGPPSTIYRLRKFARRNRAIAAGILVAMITLFVGTVVSTTGLVWAVRANKKADLANADLERQLSETQRARNAESLAREELDRSLYYAQMNLAGQAANEPGGIGRVSQLLSNWHPKVGRRDAREWEWYYLESLCHRDLQTLRGHVGAVTSVSLSPDGGRLASAGRDETIRICEVATGKVVSTLRGHHSEISAVTWSPDGKRLASADWSGIVKIWDASTAKNTRTVQAHSDAALTVAWSSQTARLASGGLDRQVKIWDVDTGQELDQFRNQASSGVRWVSWSPDDKSLAAALEGQMALLWNTVTGDKLTLRGHTEGVNSVAWSNDGSRLASGGDDNIVNVWDAVTGEKLLTLSGHLNEVKVAVWSPDDSQLATASGDGTIKVWNAETGDVVRVLRGHTDGVTTVAWSANGQRLISGGADATVKIWDADTRDETLTIHAHATWTSAVCWNPDGTKVASTGEGIVKVWDGTTGQVQRTLGIKLQGHQVASWSPQGTLLASADRRGTIRLWDTETGESTQSLRGHTGRVTRIAWTADGTRLATSSTDRTIKLWDVATGRETRTLRGHGHEVWCVGWSPNGSRLASTSQDRTVRTWDARSGEPLQVIRGHEGEVHSVCWSPDGAQLASTSFDRTVRVWVAETGREVRCLRGHTDWVADISWSDDGRRLATGGFDGTIRVWDTTTGEQTITLRGHTGWLAGIAWSRDGRRLASTSQDGTVKVWDATVGYERHQQMKNPARPDGEQVDE